MKIVLFLSSVLIQTTLIAQTPLIANAGSDQVICSTVDNGIDAHFIGGQPSATGGVPPYLYSWSLSYSPPWTSDTSYASDFFNDTSLANPTLTWMEIGNWPDVPPFVLTVTDAVGNISKDSTQILMSYFYIHLTLVGIHIHQGDSFYLNRYPDVSGGTGTLSWLWRPNHGLIDSTNAIFWAKPDTSINYYVIATDSLGCVQQGQSDYVQVTVYPLGIEEGTPGMKVKIYPNPASSYLQIETVNGVVNNRIKFTLYDMLGKKVLSILIQSELQQIDVSKLARGNYSFVMGKTTGKLVLR